MYCESYGVQLYRVDFFILYRTRFLARGVFIGKLPLPFLQRSEREAGLGEEDGRFRKFHAPLWYGVPWHMLPVRLVRHNDNAEHYNYRVHTLSSYI